MRESEGEKFEVVSSSEQHVLRYIKLLQDPQTPQTDRQRIIQELEKNLNHSRNLVTILQGKESNTHRQQILEQEQRIIQLISEALESL